MMCIYSVWILVVVCCQVSYLYVYASTWTDSLSQPCVLHVNIRQRINLWIAGMKLEPCQPLTMLHAERYEMPGAWVTIQYDDTNIRRGEFSHFQFLQKNQLMMVTKGEV